MKKTIYTIFTSVMVLALCLASTGVVAQSPSNDDVCNALFIPTDGTISYHNNYNTSVEPNEDGTINPPVGDGAGNFAWYETGITNSVWFKIVAPATGSVVVDLCNGGDSTDFDTQVALYSVGNCSDFSTFTFLAGNDDIDCPMPADEFASTVEVSCLTPGDTIFVLVDGWFSAGTSSDTVGSFSFSSTEVPAEVITLTSGVFPPQCKSGGAFQDGKAIVLAEGGGGVFSYLWSNGFTTSEAFALAPGSYTVTVSDQCGGVAVDTVVVPEPDPMDADLVIDAGGDLVGCEGAEITLGGNPTVSGGTPFIGQVAYSLGLDITTGNARIYKHTVDDATVSTNVTTSGVANAFAGDIAPGGFYTLESAAAQRLILYDLNTGAQTIVGTAASVGGDIWTGMSYDATTGTMYAVASGTLDRLYTIDLQTGAPTLVGVIAAVTSPAWIAIDTTGQMYTMDLVGGVLFSVDKSNGVATAIGEIGIDPGFAQDAAFDPMTNQLYLAFYSGPTGAQLRVVDTNTGLSYFVSTFNGVNDEVLAFGIAEDPTVPYTYNWSPSGDLSDAFAPNPIASPTANTTYTLSVLDRCNEVGSGSAAVTISAPPSLDVQGNPDNGTGNGSVTVTPTGGTAPYTYLWSTGDVTQTVTGLSADSSAFYTVTVTDANGCSSVDSAFVGSNVGIDDLIAAGINAFEVYPNPSNGVFTVNIAMDSRETLELSVLDIRGKKVFGKSLDATDRFNETLQLTDLPAGVYMLNVKTPKGIATQRLTIQ